MKKWIVIIALLAILGWLLIPIGSVSLPPGVMAPNEPLQGELHRPPVIRKGDFSIFPMASFQIEAKVLSRKRYRMGAESKLSPVDLALGWGPMSNQSVVDQIDVSQSGRWYSWSCKEPPIPMRDIQVHSANMHIIPASDEVEKTLKSVREGEIVSIFGYLVRVTGKDGWRWKSSMSRTDTGDGACEIVYAEELSILDMTKASPPAESANPPAAPAAP